MLPLKRLPRFVLPLAILTVLGHGLAVVYYSTSAVGILIANSLQIFLSVLAAAMCFRAARREPGFSQAFWTLVGSGIAVWGFAELGWAYFEVFHRSEPAPGSIIRFLFD